MFRSFVIAIATTACVSSVAAQQASDMPSSLLWNGPYIGAQIGRADVGTDFEAGFGLIDSDRSRDESLSGGIHAGYGVVMGAVTLGVEGDFHVMGEAETGEVDITTTVFGGTGGAVGNPVGGGVSGPSSTRVTRIEAYSSELEAYGTLRARAGYAVGRFHPFVTAGAAIGRIDTEYLMLTTTQVGAGVPVPVGEYRNSKGTEFGYSVGGGAEFAISPQISLRAQYVFTDFATREVDLVSTGDTVEYDTELHDFNLGVSFRF